MLVARKMLLIFASCLGGNGGGGGGGRTGRRTLASPESPGASATVTAVHCFLGGSKFKKKSEYTKRL